MLNLDMISHNAPDSLNLVGAMYSPDITSIIKKENRHTRFKLGIRQDRYFGGSDHYSFYKKDIPFIFFFTGIHPDYHTVWDNPDKVDCNKAARVSRLAFYTALKIADESTHYKLIKAQDESGDNE